MKRLFWVSIIVFLGLAIQSSLNSSYAQRPQEGKPAEKRKTLPPLKERS